MTKEEALNPKPNDKIAHLTPEEIDEVIKLYYSGKKVSEIAEAFNIRLSHNELSSLLPPIVVIEEECPYCSLPLWKDRSSRSWSIEKDPYCPNCMHTASPHCNCINCRTERERLTALEEERKRKILSEIVRLENYEPVEYQDLTLTQRTYTGAVLRAGFSEDMSVIKPFDSFDEPLSPTKELDREIFDALTKSEILKISPESPITAFAEVEDDGNFTYYIYKVYLHLNLTSSETDRLWIIDRLINPPKHNESDVDKVLMLWRKIALSECIQYLLYNMDQVGFDFNPGKKTNLVFEDLLLKFSTSQIFGIIWSGVTHASRYFQEGNVSRKQAANSVITNCQRYGEKAILNKWDLKEFNRVKECPQTSLSKIFYNRVLGIGDSGFYEIPRILYSDGEG
jgi:hypothetical protein